MAGGPAFKVTHKTLNVNQAPISLGLLCTFGHLSTTFIAHLLLFLLCTFDPRLGNHEANTFRPGRGLDLGRRMAHGKGASKGCGCTHL